MDGSLAGGTDKYILKPRKIMDNVVDVSLGRDSSACLTKTEICIRGEIITIIR